MHGSNPWYGQSWAWVPLYHRCQGIIHSSYFAVALQRIPGAVPAFIRPREWFWDELYINTHSILASHLEPRLRCGWLAHIIHFVIWDFWVCLLLLSINIRNRSSGDSTSASESHQRAAYNKCRKETTEHDADREPRNPRPKYNVSSNLECCFRTR